MPFLNKIALLLKFIVLSFGVLIGVVSAATADDFAERERLAKTLIVEVLEISHVGDFYRDIHQSTAEAFIPALEMFSKHKWPDPHADQQMQAMADMLRDALQVGDEGIAFIEANREELISDGAKYIAKYATLEQLKAADEAVKLNVTKKTLDALYNYMRIYTDYKHVDAQNIYDIVMFFVPRVDNIEIRNKDLFENGFPKKVPPQARVVKAQGIINDAVRISRIEEMTDKILRFFQDVVLPNTPLEQQETLKSYIGWGVLKYNFVKNVVVGGAPSIVAAFLDDEELDHVAVFVNTSTFRDFYAKAYQAVEIFTSITPQDVSDARLFGEAVIKNTSLQTQLSEEQEKQAKADFEALGQKWGKRLETAISPATLEKFKRSAEKVKALEEAVKAEKAARNSKEL